METLRYLVLANGLLIVVSVAYYVLLRRETFFGANRLALWLGLTAALVLPLLELPDWRPQPVRTVMQRTARAIVPNVLPSPPALPSDVTITFPNGRTYPAFRTRSVAPAWSWQWGLFGLYVAVLLGLLIRFGMRLRSLMRLIRQSVQEPYDDFTLVRNDTVASPFSFFGWVVLNPEQHTPDELEQILRHERVHVRARHSVDMLGAELVSIIFWFNPAAYLFRQLVHQTLEFSADRAVLAEGVDAQSYQYHLVKVSLSAGQSAISNHFSKSQLKSRIAMLNKPESSRSAWLKYSILCIATLTVAATFARTEIHTLRRFVPAPVAKTITGKPMNTPAYEIAVASIQEQPKAALRQTSTSRVTISADTVLQPAVATLPNPAQKSPSRYMQYEGDYLYWIVTPKMTFEDFTLIKQELTKNGCKLQLDEIKYDPLYGYIERFAFSIVGPNGVRAKVSELNDVNKPILTNAGYLIRNVSYSTKDHEVWSSRLDGRFSPKFPLHQTPGEVKFPAALRTVAAEDEAAVTQFIAQNRMDYLILAGERKYGPLGIGFRKFNGEQIKKESGQGGFIEVSADGLLSVDRAKDFTKVFINNEPASHEDIRRVKIDQLHTVAVVLGYDNTVHKRTMIDYLLFYVDPNK